MSLGVLGGPSAIGTTGSFLESLFTSGDSKMAMEDLEAIRKYVSAARTQIPVYPCVQPLIEDFDRWYQGLNWYDKSDGVFDTLKTAKIKREAVNDCLKRSLPVTYTHQQATPSKPDSGLISDLLHSEAQKKETAPGSAGVGTGIVVGILAVLGVGGVLYWKFGGRRH